MEKKPTLKELLQRHNIPYKEFYELCLEVPTEDIVVMYKYHTCTRPGLAKMLKFINSRAGTAYTVEDLHVTRMY